MDKDVELQLITKNGNDGAANRQVPADAPDGSACRTSGAPASCGLLSEQTTGSNGNAMPSGHAAGAQRNVGNAHTPGDSRQKKNMNDVIFWKVRLWMVIILFIFGIIAVIIISLIVCSAFQEDVDDKFDSSLFKVPRYFNGSFQLPNLVFTEELFNISSKQSQTHASGIKGKLADLFGSSPALGRYFSKAEINAFRNGSVIADYQLTFLVPEEEQGELLKFTLSREVVFNVFKQFLYDQDLEDSEMMRIDPVSLNMLEDV